MIWSAVALLLTFSMPSFGRDRTVDIPPFAIRLEKGEHAVINGSRGNETVVLYRGKKPPLTFKTQRIKPLTDDSVRKLLKAQKARTESLTVLKIPAQKGAQKESSIASRRNKDPDKERNGRIAAPTLYRFENQTQHFWVLSSGNLLTLNKKRLTKKSVKFDLQRVKVTSIE